MALPDLQLEMALTSGLNTAAADRVWTDISPFVRRREDVVMTRGRADEHGQVSPDELSVTLENDGRFTRGNAAGAYFPNMKLWRPIRARYRFASDGAGNYLTANQASFETSVTDWAVAGTVPPTRASSTTHVDNGTKAMLITWGTGGVGPAVGTVVTGLTIGRTYTEQARVWVPTGSPDVKLGVLGGTSGTATSTKNSFATVSVTFVATAGSHTLQVQPATSPTSGQQCWVDSVMVDQGSAVGTFTTSAPVFKDRFTGYVNDLPLEWPDGSDALATTRLHAVSRRQPLQRSRKLLSALRQAILATDPQAYWPMDEVDLTDFNGQQLYRDITNSDAIRRGNQLIAAFFDDPVNAPVRGDGTLGPTDETSLVKFTHTTVPAGAEWNRYVGGGKVMKIGTTPTTEDLTVQLVARVLPFVPTGSSFVDASVLRIFSTDGTNEIRVDVSDTTNTGGGPFVSVQAWTRTENGTLIENPAWFQTDATAFATATDGEIHHYLIAQTNGLVELFLDNVVVALTFLTGTFSKPFTDLAIGPLTLFADLWAGHAAVNDRVLDPATEISACAAAATAATETLEERVVRLAGRAGIDTSEVTVEDSWAQPLGREPEAGRTVPEILDEIATGTGGIYCDTRTGMLAMKARNSRYNQAPAFTLSTSGEEIEANLTWADDDQKVVNIVDVSRLDTDAVTTLTDDTSIDDNGDYPGSLTVVTSSDQEAIAAGQDILYRSADPVDRVEAVAVELRDLSTAQRNAVLAADIGTRFSLAGLPAQAPASAANQFAEGFTETLTDGSLLIAITTSPGDFYQNVWIPDVNDNVSDPTLVVGY